MGVYVASQLVKALTKRGIHVEGARILIMGLTFKENCPDLRNTRVMDIVRELAEYNAIVDVFDPWVSRREAQHEYGLELITEPERGSYDAIILAVAHDKFRAMAEKEIRALGKAEQIIYDLKYILRPEEFDLRL